MHPPPHAEDITGSKMEKACDLCHVTLNKNTVVGDANAIQPGGVRIGGGGGSCSGEREGAGVDVWYLFLPLTLS